jgi:hypothetical protein
VAVVGRRLSVMVDISLASVRIGQVVGSLRAVFADPRLSWRWLAMSTNDCLGRSPRITRISANEMQDFVSYSRRFA